MQSAQKIPRAAEPSPAPCDADAFEALVAPYEGRLYALCLRLTGNPEDARDAMQDGMLRLWRGMAGFAGRASFATWAYRVMTNTCLDALRRKGARPAASLDALAGAGFDPPTTAPGPHAALEARERQARVRRALLQLPPDARAAITLRDVQGLAYEDVAQALGVSLGTAKSRIHRARQTVAKALRADGELFGGGCVQRGEGGNAQ
ncbi:MAG: sigma-70 family RNA polymerase sigma factor [Oscillospiraceae bacterium]|jgi:RNA polymerase sigma-70 factor (ECF subfamily)|nr:sigma-70 family RNA polymerase sigma factor [Oscillospiraceae bacterium]